VRSQCRKASGRADDSAYKLFIKQIDLKETDTPLCLNVTVATEFFASTQERHIFYFRNQISKIKDEWKLTMAYPGDIKLIQTTK